MPFDIRSNEEIVGLLDDFDDEFDNKVPSKRKIWFFRLKKINWTFWKEIILVLVVLLVAESSRGLIAPSLYLYVVDVIGL